MNMFAVSQGLLVAATTDVSYEWARWRSFDDPQLFTVGLIAACAVLLAIVAFMYRRDTSELPAGVGLVLLLLRCVALAALVFFFLGLEKRATREVVRNSQVVVLVDTSQSMGLSDEDLSGVPAGTTRTQHVITALRESSLLDDLRAQHDVHVVKFDRQTQRVLSLPKQAEKRAGSFRSAARDGETSDDQENENNAAGEPTWGTLLLASGMETRLGDAIRDQLESHRDAPLAGIVAITDGAQNGGADAQSAAELASEARVPVFALGVGATQAPRNIAISDVLAPSRAFPGDAFTITAYLQTHGFAGRLVNVEVERRDATAPPETGQVVASERVVLSADGEVLPTPFEIEPSEAGRFVYKVTVSGPTGDVNRRDNEREIEIDVVDRQTRVLLMSGGPSRDYRFLRTVLFRDPSMQVDILLQSALPGISQEADQILDAFPSTAAELYEYDCLVAIDPDWTELDVTQVELLESWIADQAGGMIAVAGPVHTSNWIRSTEHTGIQSLYPVEFQRRLTLLDDGHYAGDTAWPLELERAGREAKFLWLADDEMENEAIWQQFPGVFGYYAVKGPKLGATVYARYSDPDAAWNGQAPVYLAGHFFGAGRVFYMGSHELWRMRMLEPDYFDVLYTKLIRHVSQGRLQRGSSRGTLLVERDRYELGETVVVRARLSDEQHRPLLVPSVAAQVIQPDSTTEVVKLVADRAREGMYVGQFTALQQGAHEIAIASLDSDTEQLSRRIQVRVPDRERTRSERDETLLVAVADASGGRYYPRLETAIYGDGNVRPVAELIEDRTEVQLLRGAPDDDFARRQMQWLLGVVCGALFTEWTVRRLFRLA